MGGLSRLLSIATRSASASAATSARVLAGFIVFSYAANSCDEIRVNTSSRAAYMGASSEELGASINNIFMRTSMRLRLFCSGYDRGRLWVFAWPSWLLG